MNTIVKKRLKLVKLLQKSEEKHLGEKEFYAKMNVTNFRVDKHDFYRNFIGALEMEHDVVELSHHFKQLLEKHGFVGETVEHHEFTYDGFIKGIETLMKEEKGKIKRELENIKNA